MRNVTASTGLRRRLVSPRQGRAQRIHALSKNDHNIWKHQATLSLLSSCTAILYPTVRVISPHATLIALLLHNHWAVRVRFYYLSHRFKDSYGSHLLQVRHSSSCESRNIWFEALFTPIINFLVVLTHYLDEMYRLVYLILGHESD